MARDYIILNGVNSNTITGLLISNLPPITKPKIRTQTEEIDGRDGDIVTKLGYSAYDKEFDIGLYGNFDIDDVIAYFNSEGTVVFSNEDDKYYNYQILDKIDFDKLIRFKKAKVKMHVQPFKYPLSETPVEIAYQYVNNEAEEMDLDNTAEAPMEIDLKGNTSQEGTPTPDSPIPVQVVSGDNSINVCGKNLAYNTTYNSPTSQYGWVANTSYTVEQDQYYAISFDTPNTNKVVYINLSASSKMTNVGDYSVTLDGTRKTFKTKGNENATVVGQNLINRSSATDSTATGLISNLQIEKISSSSGTATTYEEYKSASYPISLGVENLAPIEITDTTSNGITITNNGDGSVTLNGTATANTRFNFFNDKSIPIQDNLVMSIHNVSGTVDGATNLYLYDADGNQITYMNIYTSTEKTASFTGNVKQAQILISNGRTCNNYKFYFQLEEGNTAHEYTKNGENIELCKIGDYQDRIYKDSGKWYKHSEIGKIVYTGASSEDWHIRSVTGETYDRFYINIPTSVSMGSGIKAYCDLFKCENYGYQRDYENLGLYSTYIYPTILKTRLTEDTLEGFATWLGSNNMTVYYVLATPTNTEITDTTLKGQLEAIKNATSYDTKTHITQNANDKPFILNATALQKGSDTGIVDNIGNIYSKPTIDIEGSGTVGIYLEGNQMFSVDLSNANECIIDTAQLEAYNPSTNALMNRQVTGDYSNFKLNAGENQVSTTGDITKVTISNYTRWL